MVGIDLSPESNCHNLFYVSLGINEAFSRWMKYHFGLYLNINTNINTSEASWNVKSSYSAMMDCVKESSHADLNTNTNTIQPMTRFSFLCTNVD